MSDSGVEETRDWLDSLDDLVGGAGPQRAAEVLRAVLDRAGQLGVGLPPLLTTPYVNTIPAAHEPAYPGDEVIERRLDALIRWNAMAMVVRANLRSPGIGGHLSTYASAATFYEVGLNHFFRGRDDGQPGDQVFWQPHVSPAIYVRAWLEGRLTDTQLDGYRREVDGNGLASYPHPRTMPDFWEFPNASMGLGPISAIYQARFNRYLHNRGLLDTSASRVWGFPGDGEMDEPEARGALFMAAQEALDNLTLVINCNLQRLDGPVRGNGQLIQELEALFTAAGWNVIKVLWASEWDDLFARDGGGLLRERLSRVPDGELQTLSARDGGYVRANLFGPDPRLGALVEHLSDTDLAGLRRGGHDHRKLYAAYRAAVAAANGNDSFRPVADGRSVPTDPFDPAAPNLAAGIPLLIGTCETEKSFYDIVLDPKDLPMSEDKLLKAVARFVGIGEDAARALIDGYREGRPCISGRDLYNVISSDHMYRRNAIEAAELKAQQGGAPAWLYEFTWKTPVLGGMLKTPHTLCLPFVFGNTGIAKDFTGNGPEQQALTEAVMGAWIAFARAGNPNHAGLPEWTPYDAGKRATMIFDAECRLAHDPKPDDRLRINACPPFVSDMQFPMPG